MKLKFLFAEPAAGKSTVMKNFITTLGKGEVMKEGLVCWTVYPEDKVIIAGIYDEAVFSGTDRLSKGCGPKYREWLKEKNADPQYDDWTFYGEGERFSNYKFFDFIFEEFEDTEVYYLECDEDTLNERNANRSNQNPTWRRGMKPRMHNLRDKYPVTVVQQGFQLSK